MKIIKGLCFLLFFSVISEFSNTNNAEAAACTVTDGVYSEAEIKSGCEATPDLYEIVIYKLCINLAAHRLWFYKKKCIGLIDRSPSLYPQWNIASAIMSP